MNVLKIQNLNWVTTRTLGAQFTLGGPLATYEKYPIIQMAHIKLIVQKTMLMPLKSQAKITVKLLACLPTLKQNAYMSIHY